MSIKDISCLKEFLLVFRDKNRHFTTADFQLKVILLHIPIVESRDWSKAPINQRAVQSRNHGRVDISLEFTVLQSIIFHYYQFIRKLQYQGFIIVW